GDERVRVADADEAERLLIEARLADELARVLVVLLDRREREQADLRGRPEVGPDRVERARLLGDDLLAGRLVDLVRVLALRELEVLGLLDAVVELLIVEGRLVARLRDELAGDRPRRLRVRRDVELDFVADGELEHAVRR